MPYDAYPYPPYSPEAPEVRAHRLFRGCGATVLFTGYVVMVAKHPDGRTIATMGLPDTESAARSLLSIAERSEQPTTLELPK